MHFGKNFLPICHGLILGKRQCSDVGQCPVASSLALPSWAHFFPFVSLASSSVKWEQQKKTSSAVLAVSLGAQEIV